MFPFLLTAFDVPEPSWHQVVINGFAQGTTYHIVYFARDTLVYKSDVDSVLAGIDSSVSLYKPWSRINGFNHSRKGMDMDRHMRVIVDRAISINKDTRGLFDMTVAPLVTAWGFGPEQPSGTPGPMDIKKIKSCVGARLLVRNGNFLRKKKPCVQIDLNGIAQGYSVDQVAALLESRGVASYVAEIGGEIRVRGRKKDSGEKFRVGIESPGTDASGHHSLQKMLYMDSGAVTTSGSYRKYYESGGTKITHIINPATGYPVDNELISVTVYAADAMTADGYDNALMLMGLVPALHFVEARPGMAAYFIYHDGAGTIRDTATSHFYKLMNQ